ncbi:hypothetical protein [uncultured Alcanivorax sp.]|jgi:hypothetical protein|uniref:hypothetical protein n=1 Tax=uncultured Alcanivorax sp. TaxID=191215 RepID=UPI00258500EB|nr:hypothetical protein [uncultured Alcanivorax sp.]
MTKQNDPMSEIGKFTKLSWVPGDMEGKNLVRKLHKNYTVLGPDMPDDIGIRIIEIPPMGEIPVHDHDTDEFSSWVFCLEGYGEHIVELNGKTYSHAVAMGDGSVSTQKMLTSEKALQYKHGFKAGREGMVLMNVFRTSEVTDERLAEIQAGN